MRTDSSREQATIFREAGIVLYQSVFGPGQVAIVRFALFLIVETWRRMTQRAEVGSHLPGRVWNVVATQRYYTPLMPGHFLWLGQRWST
jgi:hypothetical protein